MSFVIVTDTSANIPKRIVEERDLKTVSEKEAYRFLGTLEKNGISATLRRSMGGDVGGACGQLRARYLKGSSERAEELTEKGEGK